MRVYDCRLPAERDQGIAAAVSAVRRGELIVMPTDTLYGLGCDAFKKNAVASMLRAKGRGRETAVPVMVGSRKTLDGLAHRMPKAARDLADAFWPGALSIIIRHAKTLDWGLGETDGTVAVRMPLQPVALEVLREIGPMAVLTASKAGSAPAATAADAKAQLGYAARIYLDGGTAADAVPSTIVDLTGEAPRVVRAGAVSVEQVRDVVPDLVADDPA
ncbi:MAG TPA: L-threonylcarbamoyladenylate synthase [Natronosporangium sp.]